jgi:dTDP-4-amino-4,6-dideoxygalactose transaminase
MTRVHLSPPDVGPAERAALLAAFDGGWIAPVGPDLAAFEQAVAARVGVDHAVALSSGTAALHLALLQAGVGPGDEVIVPTLTFAATANAVTYCGAHPVFVDAERSSWCVDPTLVAEAVEQRGAPHRPPAAVVTVDLYGQCADAASIEATCAGAGIPLLEDAAEALGATEGGRSAGSLGDAGVLSFNGNKVMTTSGGGMLVTDRADWAERARHLATQARESAPHYEHAEVGFNYRMSNLLAALGVAQLARLDEMVARRRAVRARYVDALADLPGFAFMPDSGRGEPTWWLTVATIDPDAFGATSGQVRLALEAHDIEARPAWKPMHQQPAWRDHELIGGAVADEVFATGLCLPSGSTLTVGDQDRVVEIVAGCAR